MRILQQMLVNIKCGQLSLLKLVKEMDNKCWVRYNGLWFTGCYRCTGCASFIEQVICISGDASFQMNIQELGTIAQYELPIKINDIK